MTPGERLSALRVELDRGRIVEARLHDPKMHLDGYCEHSSQTIFIDPRTAVVSTLLHELLHRRWPRLTEAQVRRLERRLIASMTPQDVWRWYRLYTRAKTTRQTTKVAVG